MELLYTLADLNAEQQAEFFDKIGGTISPAEIEVLKIGIAYFRLLKYPELKEAMRAAMAEQLFKEFNGRF